MSQLIFQQDRVRLYTALRTLRLLLSWSWVWIIFIFYKILPVKKKIPTFFFGAWRLNSNLISNYFLFKVTINWQHKKPNYRKKNLLLNFCRLKTENKSKSHTDKQGKRDYRKTIYWWTALIQDPRTAYDYTDLLLRVLWTKRTNEWISKKHYWRL